MLQHINNNTEGEILQDVKGGKEKPWKEKKMTTTQVANSFKRLKMYSRAERTDNCSNYLKFNECKKDGYKKLVGASFCRDRMCPMCNWRRSRMLHYQILQIIHYASTNYKIRYIFLTLTVKNCMGNELSETMDKMFNGIKQLFKYKQIDDVVLGWVRTLEVTRNKEDETYHPHFHILIGVRPSYFSTGFIRQDEWTSLWRKALKIDYDPIVDIRTIKATTKKTIDGAIAETAKYTVKDTDYIMESEEETDKIILVLSKALHNRRLIGYGKLFRQIQKELKLKDINSETVDLVGTETMPCTCPICSGNLTEILYRWHVGYNNYIS